MTEICIVLLIPYYVVVYFLRNQIDHVKISFLFLYEGEFL